MGGMGAVGDRIKEVVQWPIDKSGDSGCNLRRAAKLDGEHNTKLGINTEPENMRDVYGPRINWVESVNRWLSSNGMGGCAATVLSINQIMMVRVTMAGSCYKKDVGYRMGFMGSSE